MKSPKPVSRAPGVFSDAELLQLELRVAQRADTLSRESGGVRGRDLEHWLQAEQEILHQVLGGAGSLLALAKA